MLPNNLPTPLTKFIGREREIATIQQALTGDPTWMPDTLQPARAVPARLVTITGVGGSGKTRLAIEASRRLLEHRSASDQLFPDGIWFISLASLSDPALINQLVASALNLRESSSLNMIETLVDALMDTRMLLLIDNCEHLGPACACFADDLLQTCAYIAILATSRAPLNVMGEVILTIPPLETLNAQDPIRMKELSQCESVRLFTDRAMAAQPHFELTASNVRAVLQICQSLDGIPLAIELAAVRVRSLTPQQIAERLDDLFQLLHSFSPTIIARHQNLHVAFDWSYALLEEPERVIFRRLAAFSGGWTLEAAQKVVCDEYIPPSMAIDLHEGLLNQSLIERADDDHSGEARYRMLVPVWQYAKEKLDESGDARAVHDLHLAYFTHLAERAEKGILTPNFSEWVDKILLEIDNVRSALSWSLGEGDIELGLNIALALFQFWQEAWLVSESIAIYQALIDNPKAAGPALLRTQGMALALLSLSHLRLADHENAIQTANAALAIGANLCDTEIEAYGLVGLGHAYGLEARYSEALACLEKCLTLFQDLGHIPGQCWALSRLGAVALYMQEFDRAQYWLEEMADRSSEAGIATYLGYALRYGGYALLYQGDIHGALEKFLQAQSFQRNPKIFYAANLAAFAAAAINTGQIVRAARLSGSAQRQIEIHHASPLPYDLDLHQSNLATLQEWLGETVFHQAMEVGRRLTQTQIDEEISAIKVSSARSAGKSISYPLGLTEREVEVLRLVTLGISNQEIAERLVISRRTVHAHLRSIFNKLDVSTRTAAAHEAIRLKLY